MILIMFGPPGSGKGTQSQFLVDQYRFEHVSTGTILREEIKSGSELGKEIAQRIDSGKLVSDELIYRVVEDVLDKKSVNNLIFDGFPRNIAQAQALDAILGNLGKKVDLVLEFDVDLEKLKERITGRYTCSSCGAVYNDKTNTPKKDGVCDICAGTSFERRKDDNLDVLTERISVYKNETEAVTQHYKKAGLVRSINASEELNLVKSKVADCLKAEGFIKD